jgi:type I restriction enzyme S subunit
MSELPGGWIETTLARLMDGGLFIDGDWVETKDQDEDGEVRLTQLADIGEGCWRNRSNRSMTRESAKRLGCTYLEKGDVLVARMPDPLGRACMFPGDPRQAVTVVDVCVMRPHPDNANPSWLMWFLNAPPMRAKIAALQSGTTRKRISRKNLGSLTIPVPPIAEQQRIVEVIEEQFSRLDAAEASLRSAKVKLSLFRRQCFELTKQTAVPPRPITDVARIVSGQTPKALAADPAGSVPFFKVGDMNVAEGYAMKRARNYISRDTARRLKLHVWPSGTVIFPKRGGAIATNKKRLLVTPGSFDLNTMGLVPQQSLDSKFLLFWLETIDLATLSDGSNVPQINHGDIARLVIAVPSIDDQLRIVAEIDRLLTMTDRALLEVQQAAQRSQQLRRAILEDAFCGRLVKQQRPGGSVSRVLADTETRRTLADQTKRGTGNAQLEVAT